MLKPGHRIGQYQIASVLGDGGMAIVYRAMHVGMRTEHAIKVLLPNLAMNAKTVERFRQEARAQFRLRHPNIVQVTDYVETDDAIALVMDLVHGMTLRAAMDLRPGPWPVDAVVAVMRPVLDAVVFAHREGLDGAAVVHRDLKPENILLDLPAGRAWPGIPKVADFGIAKVKLADTERQLTGTNARMGTVPYMPPEQFSSAKDVDARADVWALGMMLWHLLAGRLPVDPDNNLEVLKLYEGLVPVPRLADVVPGIPRALSNAVAQALSVNVAGRFTDARPLLRAGEGAVAAAQREDQPRGSAAGWNATEVVDAQGPGAGAPSSPQPAAAPTPGLGPEARLRAQADAERQIAAAVRQTGRRFGGVEAGTVASRPGSPGGESLLRGLHTRFGRFGLLIVVPLGLLLLGFVVVGVFRPAVVSDPVGAGSAAPQVPAKAIEVPSTPEIDDSAALHLPPRAPDPPAANALPEGMALIPAGSFNMGCVAGDAGCQADEKPQHRVTLAAFYMDMHEVTVAKYKACVDAGKCTTPGNDGSYANWGKAGREEHPVDGVTWFQSDAYCKWTHASGRLPSEAQWERAARGGLDGKKFPWGDSDPTCTPGQAHAAVWSSGGLGCGKDSTWAVGTGSAKNGYGLHDMGGNIWEWTGDWYGASYYGSSPASNPPGPASGSVRVIRGGSYFDYDADYLRASVRGDVNPSGYVYFLGFRCSRGLAPATAAQKTPPVLPLPQAHEPPPFAPTTPAKQPPREGRALTFSGPYSVDATAGTVLDNRSGLTWQRTTDGKDYNWKKATSYCRSLTLGDGAWRLPTKGELELLVEIEKRPPIDQTAFPETPSEGFWTSTTWVGGGGAWVAYFGFGSSGNYGGSYAYRARCVR